MSSLSRFLSLYYRIEINSSLTGSLFDRTSTPKGRGFYATFTIFPFKKKNAPKFKPFFLYKKPPVDSEKRCHTKKAVANDRCESALLAGMFIDLPPELIDEVTDEWIIILKPSRYTKAPFAHGCILLKEFAKIFGKIPKKKALFGYGESSTSSRLVSSFRRGGRGGGGKGKPKEELTSSSSRRDSIQRRKSPPESRDCAAGGLGSIYSFSFLPCPLISFKTVLNKNGVRKWHWGTWILLYETNILWLDDLWNSCLVRRGTFRFHWSNQLLFVVHACSIGGGNGRVDLIDRPRMYPFAWGTG